MENSKKTYLKPWVEKLLSYITLIEIMLLVSTNDMELTAIPVLFIWLLFITFNIYSLMTYGKETRKIYEGEE